MGKNKQIIMVEKAKDGISIGMNGRYANLWPIAVAGVIETFVKLSKAKDVPDSIIAATLALMVKNAVEESGGLKDVVDEVIEDEVSD